METFIALIDLEISYDNVPIAQVWIEMGNLNATQKYDEKYFARLKVGQEVTSPFQTIK